VQELGDLFPLRRHLEREATVNEPADQDRNDEQDDTVPTERGNGRSNVAPHKLVLP